MEKFRAATGRTLFEELVRAATSSTGHQQKVIPALRILMDVLKSGESTHEATVTRHEGPGILLAEQLPDPADDIERKH